MYAIFPIVAYYFIVFYKQKDGRPHSGLPSYYVSMILLSLSSLLLSHDLCLKSLESSSLRNVESSASL